MFLATKVSKLIMDLFFSVDREGELTLTELNDCDEDRSWVFLKILITRPIVTARMRSVTMNITVTRRLPLMVLALTSASSSPTVHCGQVWELIWTAALGISRVSESDKAPVSSLRT